MAFRPLQTLTSLSLALALGTLTSVGFAGKKDKAAEKLIGQAMDEDYLNLELDKAESKLKDAVKLCGESDCAPEVLGRVYVALATVHGVGQNKLDVAKSELVKALKADPNAKLIDGLSNPDLEKKFKEAKAEAAGGGEPSGSDAGGEAGGDAGGDEPKKPKKPKKPKPAPTETEDGESDVGGDFAHSPVEEQAVNVPLPVFAEIPDDLGATKVILRYKGFGANKWESLTMQKLEGGWGAEIPCAATSVTGDIKYYIIGSDETGTPVATAGSTKQPFKVAIKNKIAIDPPSLPGKEPPAKCQAKEDCPPGLPGCGSGGGASERGGKEVGSICDATQECAEGLVCDEKSRTCAPSGEEPPSTSTARGRHLVSLGAQLDLSVLGSGENVCSAANSAFYVCTESSGAQFFGVPKEVNGTNGISGGLALGGARFLAGYDYYFPFGLGIGGRAGIAIGGPSLGDETAPEGVKYPKGNSFLPVHAEARASYRILNRELTKGAFAPHVFVGGGMAQVNASVPVNVCDTAREGGSNSCPGEVLVDAYQLTGLSFIGFGGGATYMLTDMFGVSGELKFMVMLPTSGFVIAPTVSPVLAF